MYSVFPCLNAFFVFIHKMSAARTNEEPPVNNTIPISYFEDDTAVFKRIQDTQKLTGDMFLFGDLTPTIMLLLMKLYHENFMRNYIFQNAPPTTLNGTTIDIIKNLSCMFGIGQDNDGHIYVTISESSIDDPDYANKRKLMLTLLKMANVDVHILDKLVIPGVTDRFTGFRQMTPGGSEKPIGDNRLFTYDYTTNGNFLGDKRGIRNYNELIWSTRINVNWVDSTEYLESRQGTPGLSFVPFKKYSPIGRSANSSQETYKIECNNGSTCTESKIFGYVNQYNNKSEREQQRIDRMTWKIMESGRAKTEATEGGATAEAEERESEEVEGGATTAGEAAAAGGAAGEATAGGAARATAVNVDILYNNLNINVRTKGIQKSRTLLARATQNNEVPEIQKIKNTNTVAPKKLIIGFVAYWIGNKLPPQHSIKGYTYTTEGMDAPLSDIMITRLTQLRDTSKTFIGPHLFRYLQRQYPISMLDRVLDMVVMPMSIACPGCLSNYKAYITGEYSYWDNQLCKKKRKRTRRVMGGRRKNSKRTRRTRRSG